MTQIRRAQSDADFARLHGILIEYEADLPPELRHGSVPSVADLQDEYAGRRAAFVALSNDAAIGCVAVTALDPTTAVLLRLFVSPQGRRRGVARSLVEAAIAFARENGYDRMTLDTHKAQLPAAYRLYQSLGFVECRPLTEVTYECPTFMELSLSRRSDLNR